MILRQESTKAHLYWSTKWELPISSTKCAYLHIGSTVQSNKGLVLSNCMVPVADQVKDLGITVNAQFRFDAHISYVLRIGHHRSQLILRCFKSKNCQLLLKAYKTYVRPVLEYNSSLWSPTLIRDIVAIEKIQRRFTKGLSNLRNLTYHQRLSALKLESLELRRLKSDLIVIYKMVFNLIDVNAADYFSRNTFNSNLRRHPHQLISVSNSRSHFRQQFVINRSINMRNSLPSSTNFRNLSSFKKSLDSNHLVRFLKVYFK